jgi:hypothetical protein
MMLDDNAKIILIFVGVISLAAVIITIIL